MTSLVHWKLSGSPESAHAMGLSYQHQGTGWHLSLFNCSGDKDRLDISITNPASYSSLLAKLKAAQLFPEHYGTTRVGIFCNTRLEISSQKHWDDIMDVLKIAIPDILEAYEHIKTCMPTLPQTTPTSIDEVADFDEIGAFVLPPC